MKDLYLLASDFQRPGRFLVRRWDGSNAGYIEKTGDQWFVEGPSDRQPIAFKSQEHAALFVCMKGRAFQHFVDDGPERIEVRVSPNFGERWCCQVGQWAATLHKDTKPAGSDSCGDSVEQAKLLGIKRAFLKDPPPDDMLKATVDADWPVIVLDDPH